ncbi:MAG: cytochrome P450 [Novosphingobium sp.]|nr:cytochrome P450 [Novosphingobium sp.]
MTTYKPIPSTPKLPIVGHLHQIRGRKLQEFLARKNAQHPEGIFAVWFTKYPVLFVTDPDIVAELSDETRFRKLPTSPITDLRVIAGDGLFTAYGTEANWGKAHRILMPAFSQRAMRGYFDLILGVVDEMVDKWTIDPQRDVAVSDDMTRLTLESIAQAGFGQSFGSFQQEELDPFLEAIYTAIDTTAKNMVRLPIQRKLAPKSEAEAFRLSLHTMNERVDQVITSRRNEPNPDAKDLLNLMLTAVDPESGETLDDVNIRYQVITFLVAGHETTSNLLTFSLYLLMRHPEVMARAYAEVDRVLPADTRMEYHHVAQLDVLSRVLDEALRLWPPAPGYNVAPYKDEVIGDGYFIAKDRPVSINIPGLHRNPKAWQNPDAFDIDRWLPERDEARHPHAYKPFGSGERACIGRQFALLEAKIALAVILQKFALHDPYHYRLQVKDMLTIKPENFLLRVRRRGAEERLSAGAAPVARSAPVASVAGAGQSLTLLYGTSLGTARDVAEQIAARANLDGFETNLASIDEGFEQLPGTGLLVAVTATYNGRAPDSAVNLERAIASGEFKTRRLPGLRYCVMGIGDSQWPNFQAFPKLVDETLEAAGAQRLIARGEADADGDFDSGVEDFVQRLWDALGAEGGHTDDAGLGVTILDRVATRHAVLTGDVHSFDVVDNHELVTDPPPGLWDFSLETPRSSTRAITIKLPTGISYRTGDHLAVYARNRPELAERALRVLDIDGDTLIRLDDAAARLRHLPIGEVMSARQMLEDFVDLQEPAPRRALQQLANHTRCPNTRSKIEQLGGENYAREIGDQRLSLLDLIRLFPALEVSLDKFIALSPPILPRFYSIASSPLVSPDSADLLVGTLNAPAWSGQGEHQGLASTYLRDIAVGDRVLGFLRTPNPAFAPPGDPKVPLLLIGPGTGFAPFRGFLQEREALRIAGKAPGGTQLFFGCRHPDHDWLYRSEMERWQAQGDMTLHLAFSAVPEHPWRFVQDALWAEQEAVWATIEAGASIYVCGDGRLMAPAVRDTLVRIHMQQVGTTHAHASAWLETMIGEGRYHQDVFGFG